MGKFIITNINKLSPKHENMVLPYEYYRYEVTDGKEKYEVGSPNGGNQTVVAFYVIPPGKAGYQFHYHIANEEVFYVVAGKGICETFDGSHAISAGDIVICPAGKNGAHRILNASETENLVYLDVDTNHTPDIAYYPHSRKVGIRTAGGIRDNYSLDEPVGYYDHG